MRCLQCCNGAFYHTLRGSRRDSSCSNLLKVLLGNLVLDLDKVVVVLIFFLLFFVIGLALALTLTLRFGSLGLLGWGRVFLVVGGIVARG